MRVRLFLGFLALPILTLGLAARTARADEAKGDAADKDAIAKNAEAFIEAFHKGDAAALAAFWTEDGDYTDETGRNLKGRAAIEKAFTTFFAENKGLKLGIDSMALRFVTPDVALEDGTTEVIPPDGGPPSRSRYTNIHVKKNGKWQLSSVREAVFAPPSNHENLHALEWLLGEWASDSAHGEVARLAFDWSEGQGFIMNTYNTTFKNISLGSGTQWIGWDAAAKRVRSWTFDVSGAFGEGAWTKDGNRWTIKATLTLPDGKVMAATNVATKVDADTITWQSKDRTLDGKPLPEIKEITLKRQK